ncbi:MAG: ribonuclease H-like domain-containing protein [Methanobacterium sp.]|uniref:DNA polymerase domain-containing protein n=1 Tax=Methanobacterium sp. TaxID=2164 RepID=UPI003D646890|nr:ribonuclease H-like domain-containing protein [Methanobacterium sp.]
METKRFILLDIDYVTENERAVVRLFGKLQGEEKGKSIIALDKHFRPYIYVIPHENMDECMEQIKTLNVDEVRKVQKKDIGKEKELLEVILFHPQDVPKLREKILDLSEVKEIREHDIPFYRRYLIDNALFPMSEVEIKGKCKERGKSSRYNLNNGNLCIFELEEKPQPVNGEIIPLRVMSFDIEVRNPKGMPSADKDEIIMISLAGNFGLQKVLSTKKSPLNYVETLENEKEMLKRFVEIVNTENPDLIIGYNSDNFDIPYITDRAKKLGVSINIGMDGSGIKFLRRGFVSAAVTKGLVHIDLYPLMRRHLTLDRYTLERVYKELFGEEKKDIDGDEIWKYWDSGGRKLEKLFEYSMDDAIAAYKIGEKMLPLNRELTRIIGQPPADISRMASGQMVEWFLIRKAREYGEVVPNKPSQYEYSKRRGLTYVGGYVKEPVKGLHENIVSFDFKSLYPSLIISKNISLDTVIKGETNEEYYTAPEVGHKFRKEPKGFIPSIIGSLLKERAIIKDVMKKTDDPLEKRVLNVQQEALKTLANSMYGVYGYARFRWYNRECADAVTAWGRDYIKNTMKYAEKYGFHAVYADTDGFYATYKSGEKDK